eukprot:1473641-Alexandrium_andersonii.AAC.1
MQEPDDQPSLYKPELKCDTKPLATATHPNLCHRPGGKYPQLSLAMRLAFHEITSRVPALSFSP